MGDASGGYAPASNYADQPPVVVNQAIQYPSGSSYSRPPSDANDYKPTLYLIAVKGQEVRPALTYWVEGSMLHYVTVDREMRAIPLASVDRDSSERLNRERGLSFRLPPPR